MRARAAEPPGGRIAGQGVSSWIIPRIALRIKSESWSRCTIATTPIEVLVHKRQDLFQKRHHLPLPEMFAIFPGRSAEVAAAKLASKVTLISKATTHGNLGQWLTCVNQGPAGHPQL